MPDTPKDPFLAGVPPRIHLEAIEEAREGPASPALDALRLLGFAEAGRYRVREIAGVVLEALAHEAERAYAVVTHHPSAGTWLTVGSRYAGDGALRRIGYTNATSPLIGVLDVPPDAINVKMAGASPGELFARLLAERPAGDLEAVSAEAFAAAYERGYTEEMDWRLGKDVSLGEVGRVAAASRDAVAAEPAARATEPVPAAASGDPHAQIAALLHQLRRPESAKKGPPPNLTSAAIAGDVELVKAFLDAGADVGERTIGFGSPLQAAAGAGRLEVVDALLARGADPRDKGDAVYSPLGAAAMHGRRAVVERLARAIGDLAGETRAVHHAASHGQAECLRILLDGGASAGPHGGQTLRAAAMQGRFSCVKLLLAAGVDPKDHPDYARDVFGEPVSPPVTPRDAARQNGHTLVADLLDGKPVDEAQAREVEKHLQSKGSLGEMVQGLGALFGRRPPAAAEAPPVEGDARAEAVTRAVDAIRSGALAGRADEVGPGGRPLLVMAAESGERAIVDALLRAGARPDTADADGTTALMEAARYGHRAVVARLLDGGADPAARTLRKQTALMLAAAGGDLETVGLLLDAGADPRARSYGKSAHGFAAGVHKSAIRALLAERTAG